MKLQALSLQSRGKIRAGFTLIELAVVILVILILAALTISMVGNVMDGDRVRGASRQVQNYLAGARDRAIYAASRMESENGQPPAIGVRFITDSSFAAPTLAEPVGYRAFGSMVFVQEVEPIATRLFIYPTDHDSDPITPDIWVASQVDSNGESVEPLRNRTMRALIDRGLVGGRWEIPNPINGDKVWTPVYYLPVTFDQDQTSERYYVKFVDELVANGGSMGPGTDKTLLVAGRLSKAFALGALNGGTPNCKLHLLPSPMPSEEPRILPRGTLIDIESSLVGGGPLAPLLRADGSFDIMFNSQGVVDGPLAAKGLIHLVLADSEDVERGFRLMTVIDNPDGSGTKVSTWGSPFVDVDGSAGWDNSDGDPSPDERQGEVLIVSLRTQTGSAYSSDLHPAHSSSTGFYSNPFLYAEAGGEAK